MRAAMAEMRLLMIELRPDALRQTDLGLLLRHLCDSIMGDSAVEATITTTEKLILPEPLHIAFYRIAQQTLNNIVRHAHATAVTIDLEREDSHAVLRIRDNGRGFDPADVPSDRFGIKLMREQALGAGAELSITSQPGAGTELVLRGTVDDRQSDPHPSRG
jgi:signal transduction histidine kinase